MNAKTRTTPSAAKTEAEPKGPRQPSQPMADEFHGKGGSYVVENGVRRRVAGQPIDSGAAGNT